MQKKKLLIAEGSEDLGAALAELFRGSCQLLLCTDGDNARHLVETFQPDVLLLDLMLPGYDGISLLQWLGNRGFQPAVLATTRFCSDYVVESAQNLGVRYLMRKPCSVSALAARISDLLRQSDEQAQGPAEPGSGIDGLLITLGIPSKLRGYTYLRHAVPLFARDPLQSVTKVLYPEVAKRCACDAMHVERSIRSAIEAGWKSRDENVWNLYFPPDTSVRGNRPTNGAFISRLAQSLGSDNVQTTEIIQNTPKNPENVRE